MRGIKTNKRSERKIKLNGDNSEVNRSGESSAEAE
jgi:hypothetical protein